MHTLNARILILALGLAVAIFLLETAIRQL
jgi:hypothetical protein